MRGTQETQAAMLLSRAIHDPAQRAKLGDDLATRAQDILFDRATNLYWGDWFAGAHPEVWPARPWQAESEKLYSFAGEVAVKLGIGKQARATMRIAIFSLSLLLAASAAMAAHDQESHDFWNGYRQSET